MRPGYQLPERRLVSQEDSSMIARPDVPRSTFKNTFSRKFPFDAGLLIPFYVDEVLPGDHWKLNFTPFVRTATPLFPIMDSQRLDIHCFFVPARILWANWTKMFGEQDNPTDFVAYTVPQVESAGNGFAVSGLGDYFCLPTIGQGAAQMRVNALPWRAYNRIWNDWYRSENLQNSAFVTVADTMFGEASYSLLPRGKSHDYFTSCLPWPQKFVAPSIQSPVSGVGVNNTDLPSGVGGNMAVTPSPAFPGGLQNVANYFTSAGGDDIRLAALSDGTMQVFAQTDVNLFRQAMQVQVFLERMARGGTRYTEFIENIFGVRNPDARLQRPEYIGGGSTPIEFTPIAQTAPTTGVPLGALGAAGTAVGNNSASYAATEHGYILCLCSVKSELSYSQGIHKMWDRRNLYDFPNPAFVGLGEQAVLRREIYATGVPANDDVVFGYQERYHEYRTEVSRVMGLFRTNAAGNIDEWHLSQYFSPAPTLGATFIVESPPMNRVLAAGSAEVGKQYLADVFIRREVTRPLPVFGTPVGLGRF